MSRCLTTVACTLACGMAAAAGPVWVKVPPERMREVYETVKTPHKVGMVLTPEKGEMLDNPTVFRHGGSWYMMFIRFDGKGYETHLAKSDDLLKWTRLGCIFRRGEKGAWDAAQADGWPALVDTRWDGPNTLNTFQGKYWMMYLGGAADGYETDPLVKPSEPYDAKHAHKPWVLKHDGVVYHFYCAVGDKGRGIALATSEHKMEARGKTEDWALRIDGRAMWFSTAESSPGKMLMLFSSPWEADVSRDGNGRVTLTYSYSHPDHPDWAWTKKLSFIPTDADEMECEFFETRANRPGGDVRAKGVAKRIPPLPPAPDLGKLAFGEPIDLLADGLDGWETIGDRTNLWTFKDGVLENGGRGGANIRTKRGDFTDFRLSYDVRADKGCNSGVYLRGIYEIQTIDSYGKEPDSHNMGAVYGRVAPSVTADRPTGEWQHVDVTLCDRHATVVLNGVKIIDNAPLRGITGGALSPDQFAPGPIMIQGSHNGGAYRNMILTPIVSAMAVVRRGAEVTWSVMHPTPLDPVYMSRIVAKAVEYGGVDSFEVCGTCHSGMGGMDGLLMMEPYPVAASRRDTAAVRKIRSDLKGCIAAAHKAGKKLYYWHREGYLPDGILEDIPGLKDADGEIDLLGEAFASYLRWKVRAAFAAVPELDGFVLTLTEADFSVVHNSNADCYPPPKVVEKIVRIFCEEHKKRGKRFVLRSFGSVAKDYEDIIAGGVAAARDHRFEIETKATPYDFSPFLPDNPFLRREPGTSLGVECDCIGEFLGAGYPPCAQVDTIHRYVTNARKAGADRYVVRIDRIANTIFDSAQEINLYAYMRFIADPAATPELVKAEWAKKRWAGCEKEMVRLSDMSNEMVSKMEFLNGNVIFHQHPVAPSFKFLKAGGMFSVLRDNSDLHMATRLWGLKNWERTPGRAAILAEKDRSVELADEGLRLLESVKNRLGPAEYARQKRAWDIATKATRATRAFIRCAVAYFDDMDAGEPLPRRLAAAVAAADKEITSMMSDPSAGVEGLNTRHSEAVGQNLDRAYFIPLRWLCREFLNEYAAEAKVRTKLKARKDVVDFVVLGGIYDDNRIDRQMHGAYPELVDGVPVRWVGNSIFPNGTIRVEFKDVPDARVEVILLPKGVQGYAMEEFISNGVRSVTIAKKGSLSPAVVAIALRIGVGTDPFRHRNAN